jgi:hypothetical protein
VTRRYGHAALAAFATLALLAFPGKVGQPEFRREMAAVKAIAAIHTAQAEYYFRSGRYASTLAELGLAESRDGYRFALHQTSNGYAVVATPVSGKGRRYNSESNGHVVPTLADPPLEKLKPSA